MSDKVKVYEIAEEAGASSADVIAKAKELNIELKSPQSAVSYEEAEEITSYIMTGRSSLIPKVIKKMKSLGTDGLLDIRKVLNPNSHKAIPRDKVKIVTKRYQRDIVIVKDVKRKEVVIEEPIVQNNEVENKKIVPTDNNGKKEYLEW